MTNQEATLMERRERADCVVSALAHATGIPYEVAYEIAEDSGRKAGGRAYTDKVVAAAKRHGIALRKVRMGTKTLRKFMRLHPAGRYLVRVRGHALSVVNGIAGDKTPLGSIVRDAWEFTAVNATH